jgi:glutamate 5-kinase
MQNKEVYQAITNHSVFQSGQVSTVNANGSYDISMKGRSYTCKGVYSQIGNLSVGDIVTLAIYQGDTQKPEIIGFGSYNNGGNVEVVNI